MDIIKKGWQFIGFNQFFENRDFLKNEYENMTTYEKRLYKMYVYSMCFETEFAKDLIWEYLNDGDDILVRSNLFLEYHKRKRKRGGR